MPKRLSIKDLLPDTDYVVQLRAVNDEETSEWSRKFKFHTTSDDVKPKVPANVTWNTDADSFVATWSAVTKNVDESDAEIIRYEMQVSKGTKVKDMSYVPSTELDTVEWTLTYERVVAMFGKNTEQLSFRVRAVNFGNNKSAWSATLTADIGQPDPPTNAVVEELNEAIKISWTPPVNTSNVVGYRVYYDTTPNFTANAQTRVYEGPATTYTLVTSTFAQHYFKIRSYSRSGKESIDLLATGAPKNPYLPDTNPPDVPTTLTVTAQRDGNILRALCSWTFDANADANKDIQAFAIRWRFAGEDDTRWRVEFAPKEARTLAIELPKPFANYEFQISGMDVRANYSGWSATVTLTNAVPGPPPQITGLVGAPSLDSIQLSWAESSAADVTTGGYYKVEISKNASFSPLLASYDVGTNSLAINGLDTSTTYYVRVAGVDTEAQTGAWSSTLTIATTSFPVVELSDGNPPSSSPAAIVSAGLGYLFVSWAPVANNDPVTYEVHISTTAGFTPTLGSATKVAEISGTSILLEKDAAGANLAYGTTYYVRIIAKDRDTTSGNAPAAGAVGSGAPAKLTNSDSDLVITAADIKTGTLGAAIITLGAGGQIKSTNFDAGTKTGFSLSENALLIYNGTVSAGVLESGSTITANLGVTGNITISSSGTIKSTNYNDGSGGGTPAGFSLSAAGLDIRTGTVWANTLKGGTVSSADIRLGLNGTITIDDATGAIQSSTYNAYNQTGWRLSRDGATFYGLNATIQAYNVIGDTISGRNLTITSGGSIHSSDWNGTNVGWNLGYNGFTMNNGTIKGTTIETDNLLSVSNDPATGYRAFSIFYDSSAGKSRARFSSAQIYGTTVLGSSSSDYVQSGIFSSTQGWKIWGDGKAIFNDATIYGQVLVGNTSIGVTLDVPSRPSMLGGTWSYPRVALKDNGRSLPGYIEQNGGTMTIKTAANNSVSSSTITLSDSSSAVPGVTINAGVGNVKIIGTLDLGTNGITGVGGLSMQSAITMNGNVINSVGAINNGGNQISMAASIRCVGVSVTGTGNTVSIASPPSGTFTANVNYNSTNGNIRVNTSLSRYKLEQEEISVEDAMGLLNVTPTTWYDKTQADGLGGIVPGMRRVPGFVAEDVEENAPVFALYEDDGLGPLIGVQYDRIPAGLLVLIKEQQKEIASLKGQLKSITSRLDAAGI